MIFNGRNKTFYIKYQLSPFLWDDVLTIVVALTAVWSAPLEQAVMKSVPHALNYQKKHQKHAAIVQST